MQAGDGSGKEWPTKGRAGEGPSSLAGEEEVEETGVAGEKKGLTQLVTTMASTACETKHREGGRRREIWPDHTDMAWRGWVSHGHQGSLTAFISRLDTTKWLSTDG